MADVSQRAPRTGSPQIAAMGALLAALGVVAGAFGAHGLSSRLDETHMRVFETAVRYHLLHAIALVAIGLAGAGTDSPRAEATLARGPAALLTTGVVLFSGSLYALALGAPTWLGLVTPFGGLSLIVGWAWLAFRLFARA